MARPRIQDPRAVPLVGRDDFLPPVHASRLGEDALRERFRAPPAWQPEFRGDGILHGERSPAAAAVLIGLVPHATRGLCVLLTQRTAHLRDHAGQISFPGGRSEAFDADATATALREAQEEVGLAPGSVEVLGELPTYTTVTHFVVTPVVGIVRQAQPYQLDAQEVDSAFEVPLSFLMTPANHQRHRYTHEGQSRDFLAMPWRDPSHPEPERFIWGATAAMLRNVYRLLTA